MAKNDNTLTNPHLAQLLDLMKENPHLPIVPMVASDIVYDDSCGFWMGSWSIARVDQYLTKDERIFFEGDDDPYELMLHFMDPDKLDAMTDEEIDAACEKLPWKKAIIVYIETPEG